MFLQLLLQFGNYNIQNEHYEIITIAKRCIRITQPAEVFQPSEATLTRKTPLHCFNTSHKPTAKSKDFLQKNFSLTFH